MIRNHGDIIEETVAICTSCKGTVFERRIVRRAPTEEDLQARRRMYEERLQRYAEERRREREREEYKYWTKYHPTSTSSIMDAVEEYIDNVLNYR